MTALALTAAVVGAGGANAEPASAGGIGVLLSPAFSTLCANHHTGARTAGSTTNGAGSLSDNLAGLPIGSALNQCGGADLRAPKPRIPKILRKKMKMQSGNAEELEALSHHRR